MRAGLISVTAGMATLLMLAAGCSDKQGGTALPVATTTTTDRTETQSPSRTTPAPSSTGGAPRVANPIDDVSRFLPQPCAALSAAALQSLSITRPGQPDTDSAVAKSSGPFCIWHSDESAGKTYSVGFITGNKNGLSDIYRGGEKAFPGYFEPTEVDGYPAVFNDITDDRSSGSCNVTVGISDTLAFRTGMQADKATGTKSCDIVKQVASAVIKTLKGA